MFMSRMPRQPNVFAEPELHNRAVAGFAQGCACHEAFTIAQVIDTQGLFVAFCLSILSKALIFRAFARWQPQLPTKLSTATVDGSGCKDGGVVCMPRHLTM
jgi:hypothetical protein